MGSGLPFKIQWRLRFQIKPAFQNYFYSKSKPRPFLRGPAQAPRTWTFSVSTDWRLRWGHYFKIFIFLKI